MAEIGTDIEYAASLLRDGQLVGMPTETVYGVAGNALDAKAVRKIFEVKKRPLNVPLIVQANRIRKFKPLIQNVPEAAKTLAQEYWPGALTMVLERSNEVPDIVVNGGSTIGLRIPDHMMTLELLSLVDFPLAVPSANIHGQKSPVTAQEVNEQIGDQIDYILDGGKCQVGLESTIIGFKGTEFEILRKGAISEEIIKSTLDSNID